MDLYLVGDVLAVVWCVWFCHFYGYVENRWFKEQGEAVILKHFSLYHTFWLMPLFGFHAFVFAHSLQGIFGLGFAQTLLLFLAWMFYEPVGLDWVWWLIRYLDITHLGQAVFFDDTVILQWPLKNEYDHGLGKPWHSVDDWDNWLHLPLLFGVYWWWFAFTLISAVLGIFSFFL